MWRDGLMHGRGVYKYADGRRLSQNEREIET